MVSDLERLKIVAQGLEYVILFALPFLMGLVGLLLNGTLLLLYPDTLFDHNFLKELVVAEGEEHLENLLIDILVLQLGKKRLQGEIRDLFLELLII
jgi:hypothetical protein